MIVTVLLLFVFIVIFISFCIRRPKHFPPGPAWLPILGNSLQVKRLAKECGGLHLALLKLSKEWKTNVLGLKLGNDLIVTVFTYPVVKAVLSSEDYDARPTNFFIKLRCLGSIKGITCTSGEVWSVQRNFVVKSLRTVGFGKRATEQMVLEEINDIIKDINLHRQTRIGKLIAPAVISVLWSLITGTRLSRKDVQLEKLLDLFERRARLFDVSGGLLGQYPWLRFIAPEKTGYNLINQINNELKALFMDAIQKHHQTWTKEMEDTDFIYSFISEMKKDNAHYSFTNEQLLMLCLDLFIAGTQTTSSTLDFAFLLMLDNPSVQLKIQSILDQEYDAGDAIAYSDRHKFPYIEAVLLEVGRYRTITPLTGPRRVEKDAALEGYVIPKNATVLIHTHSVHMDPTYWEDPHTFRPERFLNADGGLIYSDHLIPFGLGRRRCIGESLARTCIFIFFVEILRNYSIINLPGNESHIGVPCAGLTLSAEYSAMFIKRNK